MSIWSMLPLEVTRSVRWDCDFLALDDGLPKSVGSDQISQVGLRQGSAEHDELPCSWK